MESSKIFYQQTYELKNKIYKKYSLKYDDIKNVLYDAILNIYGKKYSKNIKQKLNNIILINYFNVLDLTNTFFTSNDKFTPKVLNSQNVNTHLGQDTEKLELENKFEELFRSNPLKLNKIYDEDVIEYLKFADSYSSNLYHDYAQKTNSIKLSNKDFNNKEHEYNLNSSSYSCCILELSKYNLVLEKDLLYNNLSDTFYVRQTKLIHNVTKNSEKCDIIVVNPFKFNENSFLDLIINIISSINTDLKILENNTFEFSRGLNDNWIKQNFSSEITYDEKFALFTDYINENLALEAIHYIQNHGSTIWNYSNFPIPDSPFSNHYDFNQFFSYHKRKILDAIITKDNNILFENIGEENFLNFIDLTYQYITERDTVYSSSKKAKKSEKQKLLDISQKIDQLLIAMKHYCITSNPT